MSRNSTDAILGAEREIRIFYGYRVLADFAAFMGLITLRRLSDDMIPEYAVKALPLLNQWSFGRLEQSCDHLYRAARLYLPGEYMAKIFRRYL